MKVVDAVKLAILLLFLLLLLWAYIAHAEIVTQFVPIGTGSGPPPTSNFLLIDNTGSVLLIDNSGNRLKIQ